MTTREIYNSKKNLVHTPSEVMSAFEEYLALCFELSSDRSPTAKLNLFGSIWEVLPDAIITQCDLAIIVNESRIIRDQYLLILKSADETAVKAVYKIIEESGIVPKGLIIYSRRRGGLKICDLKPFPANPSARYNHMKANLMVDGENLLLTVRKFSKMDRTALKEDGLFHNVSDKENTEE